MELKTFRASFAAFVFSLALVGPAAADEDAVELFAPNVISTEGFELGASFSPDGKSFYFAKIGEGFATSVIMVSSWKRGKWSTPEPVSFAGPYRDLDALISPDGKRMFFQSDRPTSGSDDRGWDIWISDRTAEEWGEPWNPGAPVNSEATETFPVMTPDGILYFSSDRPGGIAGSLDIYAATSNQNGFAQPRALPAPLNTEGPDSNALVAPDLSYIILNSDALPGHLGSGDLYVHMRQGDGWSEARHLPLVNTEFREFAPALSPDGHYLYFTSNRPKPGTSEPDPGDIYRVPLKSLGLELPKPD